MCTNPSLERPDFNMVARLYELHDGEDEIGGPGGRLVRHHPAGCQGTPVRMLDGAGRRGWYPALGTPEELAGKRPCQRCIAMIEGGPARPARARRQPAPAARNPEATEAMRARWSK